MIRKTLFLFILVFVLCGLGCNLFSSTGYAKSVDEMKIITENYPPYNYLDEGEMSGIAVDLMALMLKKNNSKQTRRDIKLLPWARGYVTLLNEKNTCLFSTTRTEHRENLFKWVGPISPTTVSLIARKDRKISIRTIADIKKYRIGVIIDDIGEQLLMKSGVPKDDLDRVGGINVTLQSIRKLNLGRIDMWANGRLRQRDLTIDYMKPYIFWKKPSSIMHLI